MSINALPPALPTYPGVAPGSFGRMEHKGLAVWCLGLATEPDGEECVYLSIGGPQESVMAHRAAFLEHAPLEANGIFLYRREGEYLTTSVPLPETGMTHLVLLHAQAALPTQAAGEDFYTLSRLAHPDLAVFFAQLNRATPVPLLPAWTTYLWSTGVRAELITAAAQQRGTHLWRVKVKGWDRVVERGIRVGALKPPATNDEENL